ncbi:hypothetical protein BB561_003254 [Smittium simulii]|uniref:Transcription factor CBF/NF-Y/archaeal histone domain-containing protein n=1 Tax=Smittium simulii TaxID=133385 RepID=A0A2T9YMF3_9FUNG|nr:hypothetical protein BB561_003254 [Smittium simulii]
MKKKIKTKFPVARIKRIMQMDEDVGKMAQATPILISKALELFMQTIIEDVTTQARLASTKRLVPVHLKRTVLEIACYDFLKDIVEKVVDDQPPPKAKSAVIAQQPPSTTAPLIPAPKTTRGAARASADKPKTRSKTNSTIAAKVQASTANTFAEITPSTTNTFVENTPSTANTFAEVVPSTANTFAEVVPSTAIHTTEENTDTPFGPQPQQFEPAPHSHQSLQNYQIQMNTFTNTFPQQPMPRNNLQPVNSALPPNTYNSHTTVLPSINQIHQLVHSANFNSPLDLQNDAFINQKLPPPIIHHNQNSNQNLGNRHDYAHLYNYNKNIDQNQIPPHPAPQFYNQQPQHQPYRQDHQYNINYSNNIYPQQNPNPNDQNTQYRYEQDFYQRNPN